MIVEVVLKADRHVPMMYFKGEETSCLCHSLVIASCI